MPILNYKGEDGQFHSLGGLLKGDPGNAGVVVGDTEPTDPSVKVWINSAGDPMTAEQIPVSSTDNSSVATALGNKVPSSRTINGKPLNSDVVLMASDLEGAAADSNKLGGKDPKYYIQPRNLLDNSDFTNPVNQRGLTTYNYQWQCTIDRWIFASVSTDGAPSLDITDSGITITNTTGNIFFVQRVPKALITSGNTYTLAYQKSDGTIVVTTATNFEEVGGESYQVVYVIPSGATIVWAALYEGAYTADTLPPYVPRGYAAELAECQRYFLVLNGNNIGIAQPYIATDAYVTLFVPTRLRAIPTVDPTNLHISNLDYISDVNAPIASVSNINVYNTAVTFFANTPDTLSPGRLYGVSALGDVYISADL